MTPLRFKRLVRAQLDGFRREGLIDGATHARLSGRYRSAGWNWRSLGRWLLLFGALSVAAGIFFVARELFEPTLEKGAVALAAGMLGAFAAGRALERRAMPLTRRSVELLGGLLLIGLSFVLGLIFSTGSGNWPALLLIDLLLLLPLAYALDNLLLLILSLVVFFTWFGGVTGYVSGWGAYWFGMNYPLRFLLAGLAIAGVGLLHRLAEHGPLRARRGFFRVWLSGGVFFTEMALWLMSLFGNYDTIYGGYAETAGELWLFNGLWAAGNALLLYLGSRHGLRMLRGYAITFLIIHGYTLFFWHVAGEMGPVLATFVAGCATLALVVYLERRRRRDPRPAGDPAPPD